MQVLTVPEPAMSRPQALARLKLLDLLGIGDDHGWSSMPLANNPRRCHHPSVVFVRRKHVGPIEGATCMVCMRPAGFVQC